MCSKRTAGSLNDDILADSMTDESHQPYVNKIKIRTIGRIEYTQTFVYCRLGIVELILGRSCDGRFLKIFVSFSIFPKQRSYSPAMRQEGWVEPIEWQYSS